MSVIEVIEEGTITWEDETKQHGYLTAKNGCGNPLYSKSTAIQQLIYQYIKHIIANPKEWIKGDQCSIKLTRMGFNPLMFSYPRFGFSECLNIRQQIVSLVPPKLIKAQEVYEGYETDFIFLARLGRKRNWKSGCALCLTDNIMGTTCGCGHTEIAVFRPCGHNMCANPCYYQFIENKQLPELQPKSFATTDGKKYIRLTSNINNPGFNCSLCNQKVESVFQAEETYAFDFF